MRRSQTMYNGFFYKKNSMYNERLRKNRSARQMQTERIADELVRRFDSPTSRDFFLKVAWHLPESFIWEIEERSHAKRIISPIKYFVKACNTQILKQKIAETDMNRGTVSF